MARPIEKFLVGQSARCVGMGGGWHTVRDGPTLDVFAPILIGFSSGVVGGSASRCTVVPANAGSWSGCVERSAHLDGASRLRSGRLEVKANGKTDREDSCVLAAFYLLPSPERNPHPAVAGDNPAVHRARQKATDRIPPFHPGGYWSVSPSPSRISPIRASIACWVVFHVHKKRQAPTFAK